MSSIRALIPTPLRPFAREVRRFFRKYRKFPVDGILPEQELRAAIRPETSVFVLERRSTTPCLVRVHNLSSTIWSSEGRHPIFLTLRWLMPRREPIDFPVAKIPFAEALFPGQETLLPATITAPDALGHYLVEIDLVQDGGNHSTVNRKPLMLDAQVTARAADDIDYHKVYATADLDKDYWTVVGPHTKEEFDQLSKNKLIILQRCGLKPESRVLDIGCGTGQLAFPLEPYLSDKGCFFGTDIGAEAVEFCKKKFKRPNFEFAQNEMTGVPIHNREFDLVTFFSVFTHTFPDETALLLAEAKRLLAKGGSIIGDVFLSPMVERCSGNRGMMELNKDHFMRLVELVGLKTEVLDDFPWQRYSRRVIYRYTHA